MKLLITGGCGFIGSNFVRHYLVAHPGDSVVNLDALTYAGNPENLRGLDRDDRYRFVHGRVESAEDVAKAMQGVDAVVHFAAESHVDRSIADAAPFVVTNVLGTQALLQAALAHGVGKFVYVSTDEVYGALGETGVFTEETPLKPRSPYAASKAAGDMLAQAYHETHGLPVCIVRPSNNYGPYQFPEKLVPLMITNLIEGRRIPVYGEGLQVRDWLFVEDNCRAIAMVLRDGAPGRTYNIGGNCQRRNIDVVRETVGIMGRDESCVEFVPDRPGHDSRYALDNARIERELDWQPSVSFSDGMKLTVEWYRKHEDWWRPLKRTLAGATEGFWTEARKQR